MRALVLVALLAACSKPNPYYCDDHPDDNCLIDASVDAPPGPQGCTTSADCGGTTPVCAASNVCTGCTSHGQCSSDVCLGDGSCANQADVAYVAPTGDDTGTCTNAMPCRTIAFALPLAKPHIKIQGNLDEAVVVSSGTVHFHAERGTTLRRTQSPGPIFEARGAGTIVSLADVIVRDASGSTGSGISVPPGENVELSLDRVFVLNNAATGINVQGGKLTMSRSVVSGNSLGGAIISGGFTITNSLFVANGNGVSTTGGLTLTPQTTGSTFKFNTVAANQRDRARHQLHVADVGVEHDRRRQCGVGKLHVPVLAVRHRYAVGHKHRG
jgi:hypothetical protein